MAQLLSLLKDLVTFSLQLSKQWCFWTCLSILQSNIFIFSSLSYPKLVSGSCFFLRPLWLRQSYPYSRPQQAHNNPLSFCSSPCHLSTLFLELCYSFQLPICVLFVLNSSPPHLVWSFSFPFPPKILLSWTWDLKEFLSCKGWQVHKAKKGLLLVR